MIGLFFRLLFAALCVVLVASTWAQYWSGTVTYSLHDTFYRFHPWLRETRLVAMFAVLGVCLLIARRDPLFTRIGVLAVAASLAIALTPPRDAHEAVRKIDGIRLETGK
jgi:hypothetical protein